MSRRGLISMTDGEVADFLEQRRTIVLGTVKPDGRPHLVPMWFVPGSVVPGGTVVELWTFAKAQKTLNLRRDPRATLMAETGSSYDQLRGVSLECDVEALEAPEDVERIGTALGRRYDTWEPADEPAALEAVRAQVPKRVGFRFAPTRTISWDHRKLGGGY